MHKIIFIALLAAVMLPACHTKQKETIHSMTLPAGTIKVAILLYPEVELLDFAGPSEVFGNAKGFQVYTVSTGDKQIKTKNNTLQIDPDYTIRDAPQPDILVIPGASTKTLEPLLNNQALIDWIRKTNEKTGLTMSVCTGAEFLSKAGLLNNRSATTHSGAIDLLQELTPKAKFVKDVRYVEDGKIITTAGVSAGIDGALHVVAKLKGMREALLVTGILEYDKWDPEDGLVAGRQNSSPESMMKMDHMHMQPAAPQALVLTADAKDPVCGMTLKKGMKAKYTMNAGSKTYYFCSETCKKTFVNHEQVYTK